MSNYIIEKSKEKMSQEERDKLMQDFLTKGGKVQRLKPGIAQGAGSINKSKNLQWSQKEIIQQENNGFFNSLKDE